MEISAALATLTTTFALASTALAQNGPPIGPQTWTAVRFLGTASSASR